MHLHIYITHHKGIIPQERKGGREGQRGEEGEAGGGERGEGGKRGGEVFGNEGDNYYLIGKASPTLEIKTVHLP